MKHKGKVLVFAIYFLFVIGFCAAHYLFYRDSFSYVTPYEHPMEFPTAQEEIYLDLNDASAAQLMRIPGVSRPLAEEIVRYREEIDGFSGFQQLLNVKGMPDQLYLTIGDYLYLTPVETETKPETAHITETSPPETPSPPTETEAMTELLLDLNTATAEELCLLPEIGEVTAAAIVAHREALGGFINRRQLLEISGIGESTLARIAPHLYLPNEQPLPEPTEPPTIPEPEPETTEIPAEIATDPPEIPIINLNTATAEQLMLLPNCSAELAENVLRLRDGIHIFQNILEVLYTDGMTDELYLSWEPYLAVDDAGNTQMKMPASE